MPDKVNLSTLVSNIVSEKRYSHCRLCLCLIQEQYVRFSDNVSLYPENDIFQPFHKTLSKLFGRNICVEVPGIDAVCIPCVDKILDVVGFIEKCEKSTQLINNVINNLSNALSVNLDSGKKDHALYIIAEENCSKLFWMKKQENHRKNIENKSTCIQCYKCNKSFDNYLDLKAHNLTRHNSFTCELCNVTFMSETELTLHESNSHKFMCSKCTQCMNSKEALNKHYERVHTIIVCKECGKSCRGKDKYQIHQVKHNTKFACPKCGKRYITKDFYFKHVKLCLEDRIDPHPIRSSLKKDYSCGKCAKAYSTPGGLRVHNRFVHGNAKPHVCNECGKQFTAPSYLKHHMIKHTGEKNFICDLCGSRFVTKEALLYHTRRHTGEKPYSCKICNEKFVNASARAEHIKFKHVGPTLMCEICSRKFVTSYFLKQHIRRHHDPTSKLYYRRNMIPPNMPGEQNMRTFKVESEK